MRAVMSDSLSTSANTPENSEMDERDLHSECFLGYPASCTSFGGYESPDSPITFEIDVKPKKKTFHT